MIMFRVHPSDNLREKNVFVFYLDYLFFFLHFPSFSFFPYFLFVLTRKEDTCSFVEGAEERGKQRKGDRMEKVAARKDLWPGHQQFNCFVSLTRHFASPCSLRYATTRHCYLIT